MSGSNMARMPSNTPFDPGKATAAAAGAAGPGSARIGADSGNAGVIPPCTALLSSTADPKPAHPSMQLYPNNAIQGPAAE